VGQGVATTISPDTDEMDQHADEADLIAAALRDRAEFAPLYRRYVGGIYAFCFRRLGSREEAEDAAAQVFTKALAALPSWRGGSFRAWLFAIADRQTLDRLRARKSEFPLDAAELIPHGGPSPEAAVIDADARASLRRLLAALTPDQRRVVELRLSGLNGDEIALATGRSRNAVDALQFRAVARLRNLIGTDDGASGHG
jgi:RNA polymerase sigma-70 factor (ECF subfamily)